MKKRYLKNKPLCQVTFRLPKEAAKGNDKAYIVGDFNHWDKTANPMTKLKSGEFKALLNLETGREFQFRYLLDNKNWENDWAADKYVASVVGSEENSVVIV